MSCQDLPQKKVYLAQAELALHNLLTGSKEESVQFGAGKSVKYNQVNLAELRRYINELKDQIAACEGTGLKSRGPIRFIF